ncbi:MULTISPECIES: hypothetical protein [unclassified Kitasatospora]|uniref:hypothetical protein n=1 Tax=unclassified Kitasatospora TaxID=2633591 RepID=UPI000A5E4B48|nr:hypothetical protein [Kitasatospora sp. MY 5-36]
MLVLSPLTAMYSRATNQKGLAITIGTSANESGIPRDLTSARYLAADGGATARSTGRSRPNRPNRLKPEG